MPIASSIPMPRPHRDRGIEGRMATWYAANTGKSMQPFQELARRIAGQIPEGGRVLEVAPGPGYLAIELARLGRFHITGLDLSPDMVRIARDNAARAGVAAEFLEGNSSSLPFPLDTFHFLVCRAAFKNFAQPVLALQEMHRVLRPGGRALIVDLRRSASMREISEGVDAMGLSLINRIFTKLTFRFLLIPNAYAREHIEQMLWQTQFSRTTIDEGGIGFEIWLTK
ncbi:MAG TPA: class I SAM-dependent methyltransferase [Acidobacteriaceae bacterium]|nr:class I SAM-dependent methyltransferase [Acidobacteriaceae bacterium]